MLFRFGRSRGAEQARSVERKIAGFVSFVVVGELTEEGGDVFGCGFGLGGDGLPAEAQEHEAVEEFEAQFQFFGHAAGGSGSGSGWLFGAQFDEIRQHFVVHLAVEGIFGGADEEMVHLGEPFDDVAIDLQMAVLHLSLFAHHVAEVGVPLFLFYPSVGWEVELREIAFAQAVDVALVGAEDVFDLPHVEQVFGAVLVLKLSCDEHINRK